MNKTRIDSVFLQLSEDEQARVHEWLITLGYTKTLEKLARPRPEGLNIQTHRSCLHRFYKRYQEQARSEDIAATKENQLLSNEDASVLFSDAENSFLHAAHQLATGPMNPGTFARMNQWLQAHKDGQTKIHYLQLAWRQQALAEHRHAFNREKYELKVAEMALQHAAALQRIHANTVLNHQARLRAARDILYGPLDPSPSVANPPPNEAPPNAK